MTYDHAVKVNGKWFGAGDEVETSLPASHETEKPVEKPKTNDVEVPKKETTTKRSSNKKESKK